MLDEAEPVDGLAWFGRELEAALIHKGVSQNELAAATGYGPPYVSKVKNGKAMPSPLFAKACDTFFDTSGYFERLLIRISERGHPGWFVPYLQLEKDAVRIEDYSTTFVMGILQTPEYAEAVYRSGHIYEEEEIQSRVELRMQRRELLKGKKPPYLWVILNEAVLRTVVGSPEIMIGQLQHLKEMAQLPQVTIQILPFTSGAPASSKSFILLTQEDGARILYSEPAGGGFVNESPSDVQRWSDIYDRLRAMAESEARSLALIQSIMEEYAG